MRLYEEIGTHTLLVKVKNDVTTLENYQVQFLTINFSARYIIQKNKNMCPEKDFNDIYCGSIHNSPKL